MTIRTAGISTTAAIAHASVAAHDVASDFGTHIGTQIAAHTAEHPGTAREQTPESDVYLSIIVPAWNGEERLPVTLRSISAFLDHQPCEPN